MTCMKGHKTESSKIQFINKILDEIIKDLEPSFREKLYNIGIENLHLRRIDISKRIISNIKGNSNGRGRNYWISRGWDEADAHVKFKQQPKRKSISPFSLEFWIEKINPKTNRPFTIEEANEKRKSLSPVNKEYWLERGFDIEEAVKIAASTKSTNNFRGGEAKKSKSKKFNQITSVRHEEYWKSIGYSPEEAKEKVKKVQTTFSKALCIEKFGNEVGLQIWKNRQEKWQKTLNAKSPEEIEKINKSKIAKGYCISKAEIEIFNTLKCQFPDLVHQYVLQDGEKTYIFDLVYKNKLIEFNGSYWHADPRFFKSTDIIKSKTASSIWDRDCKKIKAAHNNNFEILVIWEFDFLNNKEYEIEKCKNFLIK